MPYSNSNISPHTQSHPQFGSNQFNTPQFATPQFNPTQFSTAPMTTSPEFDILDWHPAYQSCQRYFLDHAQHEPGTQALCALVNIRLPFQWHTNPLFSSSQAAVSPSASSSANSNQPYTFTSGWPQQQSSRPTPSPTPNRASSSAQTQSSSHQPAPAFVSLIPYIRRLIITGFDKPGILHGLFGDHYLTGITPLQDCERRNYLFAAKHGGWRTCKKQYDMSPGEEVPFLKPLVNVTAEELEAAEKSWSGWLAMEDWMLGPRAPEGGEEEAERRGRGDSGLGMQGVGPLGFGAGGLDGR